jgi:hypothetical protein
MKILNYVFLAATPLMAGTITSSAGFGGGVIDLQTLFGDINLANAASVTNQVPAAPIHIEWLHQGAAGGGTSCLAGIITPMSPGDVADCDQHPNDTLHTMFSWLGGSDFQFTVAADSDPIGRLALLAGGRHLSELDFVFNHTIAPISSPVNGTAFFSNRALIQGTLTPFFQSVEIDFDTPLLAGQSITFEAGIQRVQQLPEASTFLLSGLGALVVLLMKRRLKV